MPLVYSTAIMLKTLPKTGHTKVGSHLFTPATDLWSIQ